MNEDLTLPLRPVSTYSIVAFDRETDEVGVAVQSHWFSVGSVVTWAEAGVGAVATQSFVEASYGPLGLASMKSGTSPREALQSLLVKDKSREARQVAMINTKGEVAVHTGTRCIPEAGHATGDGFSAQANLTSALISAVPIPDPSRRTELAALEGDVPSPVNIPPGCRFNTRCPYATEKCRRETPPLVEIAPSHWIECHYDIDFAGTKRSDLELGLISRERAPE